MEKFTDIYASMSDADKGRFICAMSADEDVLIQLMNARRTGKPVEIAPISSDIKDTIALVAQTPELNMLTLTEGLQRYKHFLQVAKLDEDLITEKTGEFLSLPIDLEARHSRLLSVHNTFLKCPDNFDDVTKYQQEVDEIASEATQLLPDTETIITK